MKLYRVVEARWVRGDGRVETDIGCEWKPVAKAKDEMRELSRKHAGRTFSIQLKQPAAGRK